MAAAIKDKYGLKVGLKEGHGGVLKVTIGDTVVYNNKCSHLPTVDEVIKAIEKTK